MNKLNIFLFLIAILFLIIIGSNKNKEYELNFLWSKGLKNKTEYSLKKTKSNAEKNELKDLIENSKDYLWIRSSDIKTFSEVLHYLNKDIILVTGDGDNSIPEELEENIIKKIISNKHIKKWYTQNYTKNNFKKIKPYPIGLDLHTKRDSLLGFFTTSDPYKMLNDLNYINGNEKKHQKIFCDVHLSTYDRFNNERARVRKILKKIDYVDFLNYRTTQYKVWKKYNQYQFVISAHGNGLDCHRTWEAIYLGAIVIVKTSSLDNLYENLPVVIVKDWDECKNIENLKIWKDKYLNKTDKKYLEKFFKYDYWLHK